MEQCVTASQIADAFMVLLEAEQQSFLWTVFLAVLALSLPSLLHRLFDYLETKKASA